jgi:hypothetical protein
MKDEHVLTYKLEPVKPVNQKELIDRAKEMGHRAIRVPVE